MNAVGSPHRLACLLASLAHGRLLLFLGRFEFAHLREAQSPARGRSGARAEESRGHIDASGVAGEAEEREKANGGEAEGKSVRSKISLGHTVASASRCFPLSSGSRCSPVIRERDLSYEQLALLRGGAARRRLRLPPAPPSRRPTSAAGTGSPASVPWRAAPNRPACAASVAPSAPARARIDAASLARVPRVTTCANAELAAEKGAPHCAASATIRCCAESKAASASFVRIRNCACSEAAERIT
eukprot:6185044-Pleurochrysis_carterae.AAC.1